MFVKLGAGYQVLRWEKFHLHPVKKLSAQGQRVPAGVVIQYRHCFTKQSNHCNCRRKGYNYFSEEDEVSLNTLLVLALPAPDLQ